ncbi:hypothetical protein [Geopsychrobacter electrodiphilus]|uniref:hypothetical protein n=1 Tax=Geopsychrobacter electrodiphilus TaxID=225196 RepID=UPI0003606165|nr:hypothetical protein [Geopsychrobacter electrodiphilus]
MMRFEISSSLNLPLCLECGGRCCQGSPGIWVDPERFFALFFHGQHLSLEQLRGRLSALNMVLWEKTGVPVPAPRSLQTGCSFLGVEGCRFPVTARPCQCLAMTPNRETLIQAQGCLCLVPAAFNRRAAQLHWQEYWQSVI